MVRKGCLPVCDLSFCSFKHAYTEQDLTFFDEVKFIKFYAFVVIATKYFSDPRPQRFSPMYGIPRNFFFSFLNFLRCVWVNRQEAEEQEAFLLEPPYLSGVSLLPLPPHAARNWVQAIKAEDNRSPKFLGGYS